MTELVKVTENRELTSRLMAEMTGKRHADVMRDIRDEISQIGEENGLRIFALSSYVNAQNKQQPMFRMTEKGWLQIAARYDAKTRFTLIDYIDKKQKGLTRAEQLLETMKVVVEQERRVKQIESRLDAIQTASEYFTIIGYFVYRGMGSIDLKTASKHGRVLSKMASNKGVNLPTVPDPRFGKIKTYPLDLLDEYFVS